MKTIYKKAIILSVILISMMMWTKSSWAQTMKDTITAIAGQTVSYTICDQQFTEFILYKPTWALTSSDFFSDDGYGDFYQDSIVITTANDGVWIFDSGQGSVGLNITFTGQPVHPTHMVDTNICTSNINLTISAENPGSTYLWDNASTGQVNTFTTPGTHWVRTTNTCGSRTDTIHIMQNNPNAPNLGPDQTFCLGNNSILTTGSSNIASCTWSTGETTNTISVSSNGFYSVYLIDNNGCSGRDTIQISTITTPSQEIELATINTDPQSPNYGNNKITWQVNPAFTTVTKVVIYRESGTDNYIPIDTVNYIASEWSDVVNSIGHSWKYKISLIGSSCGEGSLSESVQTIHCWVSQFGTTYTIQWDPYSIGTKSNSVNWYKVLSGNALNGLTIRDSVSGNLTSLSLPNTTDSIFVVGAELAGGKGFGGLALSNKTHNPTINAGIAEMGEIPFSLYPNPAKELVNISINLKSFRIEVSNIVGQVLLSQNDTKSIDISSLTAGSYIISIIADNIKTNKKFVKQ